MASMLHNITKGVTGKLKQMSNPYKKFNINWVDLRLLKNKPKQPLYKQKFLNGYIQFHDAAEFLYGVKEIFIQEIYKQTIKSDALIIDCGANIGLSVIYLRSIYPKAKIIAFEPDEKNFELLRANISSQAINNVELKKEAVWTENTMLSFESQGTMSSKISENSPGNTGEVKKVKATRLKEILSQPVDFLKIDIEGAEYQVLKDIKDQLFLVNVMFLEYHGTFEQNNELIEMLEWVRAAGFSFYIKEAAELNPTPFYSKNKANTDFDVQLNIFCFRQ